MLRIKRREELFEVRISGKSGFGVGVGVAKEFVVGVPGAVKEEDRLGDDFVPEDLAQQVGILLLLEPPEEAALSRPAVLFVFVVEVVLIEPLYGIVLNHEAVCFAVGIRLSQCFIAEEFVLLKREQDTIAAVVFVVVLNLYVGKRTKKCAIGRRYLGRHGGVRDENAEPEGGCTRDDVIAEAQLLRALSRVFGDADFAPGNLPAQKLKLFLQFAQLHRSRGHHRGSIPFRIAHVDAALWFDKWKQPRKGGSH